MIAEMDWDAMLRDEMDWAIAQRRQIRGEDEFTMRVKIVGPHGEVAVAPLQWTSGPEKRRAMSVLSATCCLVGALAAIIVSDSRFLDIPAFCKYFQIAEPQAGSFDAFERDRQRIMQGYDFYMGNLPRETFKEALVVAIRGPRVCRISTVEYTVADEEFTFLSAVSARDGAVEVQMLPAWWQ
jgi:hypothetical protein